MCTHWRWCVVGLSNSQHCAFSHCCVKIKPQRPQKAIDDDTWLEIHRERQEVFYINTNGMLPQIPHFVSFNSKTERVRKLIHNVIHSYIMLVALFHQIYTKTVYRWTSTYCLLVLSLKCFLCGTEVLHQHWWVCIDSIHSFNFPHHLQSIYLCKEVKRTILTCGTSQMQWGGAERGIKNI